MQHSRGEAGAQALARPVPRGGGEPKSRWATLSFPTPAARGVAGQVHARVEASPVRTYVRVDSPPMEPAVHRITILTEQPAAIWGRLESVLEDGGSPPISMVREPSTL